MNRFISLRGITHLKSRCVDIINNASSSSSLLTGILGYLLGFCVGAITVLMELKVLWPSTLLFLLASFRIIPAHNKVFSALVLFGLINSYYTLNNQYSVRLAPDYEPKIFQFRGLVDSLPQVDSDRVRFDVRLVNNDLKDTGLRAGDRVRLYWYDPVGEFIPGSLWSFTAKLKAPPVYLNPGSFNYPRYLSAQSIYAVGYIASMDKLALISEPSWLSLNYHRYKLRETLLKHFGHLETWGFINALILGDKSQLTREQGVWLTETGLSHLFVISGMHIGLVATFCCGFVYLLFPLLYSFGIAKNRMLLTIFCVLPLTFLYACIAGFSVPVARAWIMLCCMSCCWYLWGIRRPLVILLLSLAVVLTCYPASVVQAGFWLSFSAVFALIFSYGFRLNSQGSVFFTLLRSQSIVFIGLLPVYTVFSMPINSLSFVFNLLAIPLVSFVVLPLTFIAGITVMFSPTLAANLFRCIDLILENAILGAQWCLDHWYLQFKLPYMQWWQYLFLSAFCFYALLPKGFLPRRLSILLCLPLLMPAKIFQQDPISVGNVVVNVLDVGQGLAVLLRTQNHHLLFDTGSSTTSGFNTGDAVVLPFLRHQSISQLNMVVISHGDNDHIGGLAAIIKSVEVDELVSHKQSVAFKDKRYIGPKRRICQAGENWVWDGVNFEILYPKGDLDLERVKENNRSCVLRVTAVNGSVIVTGDIEASAELALLNHYDTGELRADVLIVPHHGSQTSSSIGLINAVKPSYAVVANGRWNHFGHPHSKVVNRYLNRGIQVLTTAEKGMIEFSSRAGQSLLTPSVYRD